MQEADDDGDVETETMGIICKERDNGGGGGEVESK